MQKILIKAPSRPSEILATFPFIHKLNDLYSEVEINIILNEGVFNYYLTLPFRVNVYELPNHRQSITGVHKFAYGLNEVFNIDSYFNLEGKFLYNFMGRSFKAKQRIGLKQGIKSLFLTNKLMPKGNSEFDIYYMSFLEGLNENNYNDYKIIRKRAQQANTQNDPKRDEIDPFLFVYLDQLNDVSLFNSFQNKYFKIVIENNQAETEQFDPANKVELLPSKAVPEVVQQIVNSRGVITNQLWVSHLSNYLGVNCLYLNLNGPLLNNHFKHSSLSIDAIDGNKVQYQAEDESMVVSFEEFTDFVESYLKI